MVILSLIRPFHFGRRCGKMSERKIPLIHIPYETEKLHLYLNHIEGGSPMDACAEASPNCSGLSCDECIYDDTGGRGTAVPVSSGIIVFPYDSDNIEDWINEVIERLVNE
jgi:hypothetical protein